MSERKSVQSKTYDSPLLVENGKNSYLNPRFADVNFLFNSSGGTVTHIPAHKHLLAMSSDVFEAMFYGESRNSGDIEIVSVSEAEFMEFLQYFYLSKVDLTAKNILGVMHLGRKYNVAKCITDCTQFLVDTLDDQNICTVLQHAIFYGSPKLIKACEKFIVVNTAAVFGSAGFLQCDQRVLAHILIMNVLSCPEVAVFEACMAWVKARCGENPLSKEMVVAHLGHLYYDIRFTSMTIQQFCSLATKYDSVLRSDYFTLTNMIVSPEFQSTKGFAKGPRQARWNEVEIIKCDRSMNNEQKPYKLAPEYKMIFGTDKPLLLGSFVCMKIQLYRSYYRDLRLYLPVDVEITEANDLVGTNTQTLVKIRSRLQSKDTIVSLPHPILIRPGFFYTVSIGQFPDDHCYFSYELKAEVELESGTKVKFHECSFGIQNSVVDLISVLNFNDI